MTDQPLTVEQLLDTVRPLIDRPRLDRIEIGEDALGKLLELARVERPGDPRYSVLEALGGGGLFGVPLVIPEGDAVLDPRAWRLLDTDGHVIKDGTL